MSDLINTILWGGPTPGLSACSKPSQPAQEQEIIINREEFGGSWKPTEVDECERDHVLNSVFDASKTLLAKNFAKLYSLWANVARKVFGRDQFKKPFEGLSPYQQDYAVAMLADRLNLNFWEKKLSHIMSWSAHWFGCKTDELWGYIFPHEVNLGVTPSDVVAVLNAAKIEAGVMVDELEMPKGGRAGEIKITLIPASFKSKYDPLVSPAQSVPFDKYVDLPSEEATEGKYLIDLGPGIRIIYPGNLPSRDEAGNIQITVQFDIDENTAIICGSAIKERDMVVLYKPKYAEKPYKIATVKNALTKKPVKKPVTPPPPPPPTPPGKEDCENSGGTWMTVANKCNCPPGMNLKGKKCVTAKIPPSPDKEKCVKSGGTWKKSKCNCPPGKKLEGKKCVKPMPPPPPKGVCDHLTHLTKNKRKECNKECGAMTKETERNECIEMYAEEIK
ncbi:hypothetical protein AMJ44_10050 [candidate division WOR-1 bacterium DG_54_3]|uniref:Uncharacterized protein n=1 Tax=candidate division WOR-1 bacterium DG_54_3 TaxID=1703775 RepID=A0A0S7XST6_UNCSA|nr:MAG: hypothetical protein AMJ44_10050 [candidate division WOR-1 bacterium DG_54_3]